jgi:spermidine/putrescine-binding protein
LHYAVTWKYAASTVNKNRLNWKMAKPKEGTTICGGSLGTKTTALKKPQKKLLAKEWINYTLGVKQQSVLRKLDIIYL